MMTAQQLDMPVRRWVPDWVATALLFVIIMPVSMLNGTYTGSMLEVSNTLGAYTEDITVGFYAAAAGMAIAYPIVPKVLNAISSKSLLLVDLTLQFLLSLLCARSTNTDFLIIFSFAIGFLKGFLMLWVTRRIKFIFSPRDVRSEFYAYFYPLVFSGGQISMVVTALLAYHYDWKYMYYFMMMLLMIAILLVILLLRHDRPSRAVPLKELHLREMMIVSTGLLMLICDNIRQNIRLDGIDEDLPIHRHCPFAHRPVPLGAIQLAATVCQPAPVVAVEGHPWLHLHDACHVFQHVNHIVEQLHDIYPPRR